VGKYANWKRVDAVLRAAKLYQAALEQKGKSVATLMIGTGPLEAHKEYETLLHDLGIQDHTFLVGPHQHNVLAQLFDISDVGQ